MKLCDGVRVGRQVVHYPDIVHDEPDCPLCEAKEELGKAKEEIEKLEEEVEELKSKVDEMEDERDEALVRAEQLAAEAVKG